MTDFGQLVFFLVLMVVLSLMDALGRRARQRQADEMERREHEEEAVTGGTSTVEDPAARARLDRQRAARARAVRERRARERAAREQAARERVAREQATRERASEERTIEVWVPPEGEGETRVIAEPAGERRAIDEAPAPPLLAAAEELRAEGRRELQREPSFGPPAVTATPAPSPRTRPRAAVARADRLRVVFRGDPSALRRAVLYREVLGEPVGSRRGPGGWEERG
jgi:hypothetical protein